MEIVDAQIHQPHPARAVDSAYGSDVTLLVEVEIAREAMDSVGVDAALVFAAQDYIDACVDRYPDRFAGAPEMNYLADDLEEQIVNLLKRPKMLAGRNLIANYATAELRPEFHEGKFERLYTLAERHHLPLFFSTHGWAHRLESVAQRHPGLVMIVDHLGVSQSPASPARAEPWDKLPGLLGLAKYRNVHVKFSGVPVMARSPYPFNDVWPYLHQVIDAFGPDRLMWGSDFTRMRWVPVTAEIAPRDQWRLYSDCVSYLRDTGELSASDKEKIFSSTIRRVLRWDLQVIIGNDDR